MLLSGNSSPHILWDEANRSPRTAGGLLGIKATGKTYPSFRLAVTNQTMTSLPPCQSLSLTSSRVQVRNDDLNQTSRKALTVGIPFSSMRGSFFSVGLMIFLILNSYEGNAIDLTIEELQSIIAPDYDRIDSIATIFNYKRLYTSSGTDPNLEYHQYFKFNDRNMIYKEETMRTMVGDRMEQFQEIRAWNGSIQTLFLPSSMRGLITREDEHNLYFANTYYKLAGIWPFPDKSGTWDGSVQAYVDSGQVSILGIEMINGYECYKLGFSDALRKVNLNERVLFISPELGFALVREILFAKNDPDHPIYQIDNLDFEERPPFNRHWPTHGVITWHLKDKDNTGETVYDMIRDEVRVEHLDLTASFSEEEFLITFPPGTHVEDRLAGSRYFIPGARDMGSTIDSSDSLITTEGNMLLNPPPSKRPRKGLDWTPPHESIMELLR